MITTPDAQWQDESSGKQEGGLGLAIMDTLMESVMVEPFADGTTVTMKRHLLAEP